MKCPNCGEEFSKKRRFCVLCGADLSAAAPAASTAPPPVPKAPMPMPAAQSVVKPSRPITAEDFFGTPKPVKRPEAKMNDLSVEHLDISRLEAEQKSPTAHRHYMKPASADQTDTTNTVLPQRAATVQMAGAAPDGAHTLEAHQATESDVRMDDASGTDAFNTTTHGAKQQVAMSDELKPVEALPKRHPIGEELDDIEIPSFIRARRKHTISLEIPSL